MTRGRLWGQVAIGVLVGAFMGVLFGWYQAYPAQVSRDRAMLRLRLSEARVRTLDARVALSRSNFGDATGHVREALRLLDAFKTDGADDLPPNEAAKIDQAAQALREAQGLFPNTDPGTAAAATATDGQAAARAALAGNLLGEVYRSTPEP
ncbi:MAG: hypothetical protein H0V80_13585 [Acidobacteria bacterium]|nr:hypothetical protein [Acidobacteriota bacterium]